MIVIAYKYLTFWDTTSYNSELELTTPIQTESDVTEAAIIALAVIQKCLCVFHIIIDMIVLKRIQKCHFLCKNNASTQITKKWIGKFLNCK